MRFFNCKRIWHELIQENGKNKTLTKLGGARLIFDGEGIVTCTKKGGLFWSTQTWLKLTMTRPNIV